MNPRSPKKCNSLLTPLPKGDVGNASETHAPVASADHCNRSGPSRCWETITIWRRHSSPTSFTVPLFHRCIRSSRNRILRVTNRSCCHRWNESQSETKPQRWPAVSIQKTPFP